MRDTLFIQPRNIYERTQVHSNIDDKMITPIIKVCQDMYILPAVGTALYTRLQDGIENNNLTADEETLLKDYIRDSLIYYVVSELPMTLSYQFWNKGVLKGTAQNSETIPQAELFDLQNKYKNFAEYYRQRLIKYLIEESGQGAKFPEYINPGSRADTIVPVRNGYNTGIWLGATPERKNPYNPDEYITHCKDCDV